MGLSDTIWRAHYWLAKYQKQTGDTSSALQNLLQAQEGRDILRQQLNATQYKLAVLATPLPVTEDTVLLHEECGNARVAFDAAESGRSRVLLDILAFSALPVPLSAPPELSERLDQIAEELKRTFGDLNDSRNDQNGEEIMNQLARERKRMEYSLDLLEASCPEYTALRRAKPVSYTEVQKCLTNA
jgi:hypothetical protein